MAGGTLRSVAQRSTHPCAITTPRSYVQVAYASSARTSCASNGLQKSSISALASACLPVRARVRRCRARRIRSRPRSTRSRRRVHVRDRSCQARSPSCPSVGELILRMLVRLSDFGQLEPAVGGVCPDLVTTHSVRETRERAVSRRRPARDLRRGPVGSQNVRTSERQNVRTSESQNVRTSYAGRPSRCGRLAARSRARRT